MLIDVLRAVGLERMAQVDLGTRQNRHQPLAALSRMALEVLAAAERRTHARRRRRPARPAARSRRRRRTSSVRAALTDEAPAASLTGLLRRRSTA